MSKLPFCRITAIVLVRKESQARERDRKVRYTDPIAQQKLHVRQIRGQQAIRGHETQSDHRVAGPQRRRKVDHNVYADWAHKSYIWHRANRGLRYKDTHEDHPKIVGPLPAIQLAHS